jgi:hypothetical protein
VWQAAISDAADLFSHWGLRLIALGFNPGDLSDVPHSGKEGGGLCWFMKGSPVMAPGKGMAQLRNARIWRGASDD